MCLSRLSILNKTRTLTLGRESQGKQGGCVDSHMRTDCRRAGVRQTVCHTFVGSTGISLRPEELEHLSSVFDTYDHVPAKGIFRRAGYEMR